MMLQNIDKSQFLAVNRFAERTPGLHGFMLFVANEGVYIFILLLVVVYLLVRFMPKLSYMKNLVNLAITGIGTVVAVGINQPISHIFKEPRPYDSLSNILVLIHRANDYSFPSDHGVMVGAVTTGLFLIDPILGVVSLVIGLLVAFSRVYTAAHYPHDLVAGMVLGMVVVLLCYALLKKPAQLLLRRIEQTSLRMFLCPEKLTVVPKEK